MGDIQAKPIQNQDLKHLQQQYEPFSKGKLIPGDPIYLKLNSIFQKSQYCDRITNRFKKLQRYHVSLRTTEQGLQAYRNIYDFRRTNLPCIVQVVYYSVGKDQCQCSSTTYRVTVYTEHVETRLAHYKTRGKVNNPYPTLQYYDSFTLDEGIYILICCLHAYQVLTQQFVVNYPTPLTIGINYKAQVKVWIHQNWGMNEQNYRKLNENLIIEEIINLIEERMEANFNSVLNVTATYMNFTFSSIQEMLSKYTINYQRGKKSLEDRLNNRFIKDKDKSTIFSQKIPLNRNRTNSNHNSIISPNNHQVASQISNLPTRIAQKRHSSHEYTKKPQLNIVPNTVRNYSITPRTTTYESPKKIIKFVYQQSSTQRQPSKAYDYRNQSKQAHAYFEQNYRSNEYKTHLLPMPQPKQIGHFGAKPTPYYSQPMTPLPISSESFDRTVMNSIIDKKLKSQSRDSSINHKILQSINSTSFKRQSPNILNNISYNFDKFKVQKQSIEQINPFELSNSKEQRKVQFNLSEQYLKKSNLQLNKTSQNGSLSEITEQFKHLLKSDHKIEQRQQLFYNYNDPQATEKEEECIQRCLQQSQHQPYISSFEEIKEQDEDINYSIDQPL